MSIGVRGILRSRRRIAFEMHHDFVDRKSRVLIETRLH